MKHFLYITLLFLTSCRADNFPKYSVISDLRILALKTNTPEISPGDTIPSVSALVLDPAGNGRTITYSWTGCLESFTESSTKRYECANASDKISLGSGTSSTGGIVSIPSTALDAFSSTKAYNGINYIVAVTVAAGSERITGFKRIVISASGKTKNSNPTISGISRGGLTLTDGSSLGTSDAEFTANVSDASFETFSYKDALGNTKSGREDVLVTWFTTEGLWKNTRTFGGNLLNLFTPPNPKTRSTVTIAVVAHDGRGGIEWSSVNLQ